MRLFTARYPRTADPALASLPIESQEGRHDEASHAHGGGDPRACNTVAAAAGNGRSSEHSNHFESLEVLGGKRLLIANDNNYPGSDGRWIARDKPDDVELIVVRPPTPRQAPSVRRTDDFVARGRVGSKR